MAAFLKKLDRLVKDSFPQSSTELEQLESSSKPTKVGGFVVWSGFSGVDTRDRVRAVWDVLERGLTEREMSRISVILPYTPIEMEMRREELALEENGVRRAARVRTS
jgi:hypothetical protein